MVRRFLCDFDAEILFGAWRTVKMNIQKRTRRSLLDTMLLALVI